MLGVALTFALFYPAYSLAAVETGRGIRRKSNAKLRPRYLSWRSHAVSAANRQVPQARHPRAWGADSPPRLAVNEHPAGGLFNRENLALRENNSPSSCVSPAAVAVANHPARSIGELITPTIMHGVILSVGKIRRNSHRNQFKG